MKIAIQDAYPKLFKAAVSLRMVLKAGPVPNSVWCHASGYPVVALLLPPPGEEEAILSYEPGLFVHKNSARKLVGELSRAAGIKEPQ